MNRATIASLAAPGGFHDGDWVESKDQDPEGDIRLLQLADVGDGSFRDRSDRWINEKAFYRLQCSWVRPGDVLIARMPDPLGRACLVPVEAGRTITVVDVAVLRCDPNRADRRFATYAINSLETRNLIERLQDGATRQRISRKRLGRVQVPAPPASEQRLIADYLDRETAKIDTLIEEQQRLIEMLRERRVATIAEHLPELDGTRLKRVATVQSGVTLSGEGDADDPDWPYLRVANVQVGRVELDELKTIRVPETVACEAMLQAGDVLMTEGGDIDKLGRGALWEGDIEPMLHQNHIFAVRTSARLAPEYLVYWLDGPVARNYFRTTAKKTTNLAATNKWILGNLPVPCPPHDEQRRIVAYLDGQIAKIDELAAETERFIELSRERRSALITAAVTGQIDVGEAA